MQVKCLLLLLAFPFVTSAQISRSANEHARETTREYLTDKLFKGKEYKPGWYGNIQPTGDKRSYVVWKLEHKFVIADSSKSGFEKTDVQKTSYHFQFFLDNRMKVVKAESFFAKIED